MRFYIIERNDPLAVHGIFDSLARAERHLTEVIPDYVRRGYFMDKTLTASCFMVVSK